MSNRPVRFDEEDKRKVAQGLALQRQALALQWHDTVVFDEDWTTPGGQTFPAGTKLTVERSYSPSQPMMVFRDKGDRRIQFDGLDLVRNATYSVIPAPDDEPF